ncbi:DUF2460 domain-containing protein [Dichotomicrobium thermohalophilum]|uniref:Uncharacterized protein (TIGR02217 family) n=1 Tax=Dichotomicrobium thermohalophilum TaxID=933063 RepID=A0A397Q8C9_9HYPH|nr:DUF2460 domain-containing protein [Dichotomicrobium thermohalophilum]RIA56759.1 uncharacterized protein (TIGR02217 family) [Dichotomicrobium thermohalophilum]
MAFHDVRFPPDISRGASGGPERRTEIVTLGSGHEERNQRWADSRRRYDAGYGIRSVDDLYAVIAFFEERRGRLHAFRWKDWADYKSCPPLQTPSATDQEIGNGDGHTDTFQLRKTYGSSFAPWSRTVTKPVAGTVLAAVDGIDQVEGADFSVDHAAGVVTFASPPVNGARITAGFVFDVPVRFDTDRLAVSLEHFSHGHIPNIPIVEVRL